MSYYNYDYGPPIQQNLQFNNDVYLPSNQVNQLNNVDNKFHMQYGFSTSSPAPFQTHVEPPSSSSNSAYIPPSKNLNSTVTRKDDLAKLQNDFIIKCLTSRANSSSSTARNVSNRSSIKSYSPIRRSEHGRSRERSRAQSTRSRSRSNSRYHRSRSRSRRSRSISKPKRRSRSLSRTIKSTSRTTSRSSSINNEAKRVPPYPANKSRSPSSIRRKSFIEKWRMNNCSSRAEMKNKLEELSCMRPEDILKREMKFWTRSAPADLYYKKRGTSGILESTEKLTELCQQFEEELVNRGKRARAAKPPFQYTPRKKKLHKHVCCNLHHDSSTELSSDNESEEEGLLEELERKKAHPDRLHAELWFNDPGEMNDGPLCRCSAKAKRSGIRHNIYAGELSLMKCDTETNNAEKLFHYRITISPPTNFLIKTPTVIEHDHHEFIFEGFSMFSHKPLENLPVCKVIRFNIEYTILYIDEAIPQHFTIQELDLFHEYLFKEILELVDLDFKAAGDANGCAQFHFMPRFVRELPENGKEILSMNYVLDYLLKSSMPLIPNEQLSEIIAYPPYKWQRLVDEVKGMVVTFPGKKPCSIRVDQLDKDQCKGPNGNTNFPEIVHFGIRPPQLSYAGNPEYQKAWREYVKFRHLLANMPKSSYEDKRKLEAKENRLQEMRTQSKMKRDVTIAVSSEGFFRTGIMCDIVQHAMLLPVLVAHLRFHRSLDVLENKINYKFKNRSLLQLALTHPSYRENFGTNPDHARNSLTNCGIRQPEYGDRRIHYMNTRKRGINTLINIMSRFGKNRETESNITHNERLEFLGDAVVEFVSSIHLFHLFPRLEEGGLATYRAAIVQNQHLAVLAKTLGLDGYMLYAHGSDLCHDLELRHAMANCFEALMGALFLDGGIDAADEVFGKVLFEDDKILLKVWQNYPPHPLQEEEPSGDRQWIPKYNLLKKLTKFEDLIGVQFNHIRLLARAFTDRSIGFTNLTLGSNQRLEFLGDTVLQLIASEYLYKYFPEHHEGHLSLLRSSLVNNRTQAVVCDDLGMATYAVYSNPKAELKTKDRADLLEAYLGALYVDKGLEHCQAFCNVCFFPRLHDFIMNQDWNDPKSKLQQCCLTLRTMEGGEPEIPVYKVIECMGPTNTRLYTVAVYFKGKRLAEARGHSIQQAEMNAAKEALDNSQNLFPQLDHQKRVIAKSIKQDPSSKHKKKNDQHQRKRDSSPSSTKSLSGNKSSDSRSDNNDSDGRKGSSTKRNYSRRRRRSFSYSRGIRSSSCSSAGSVIHEKKKFRPYRYSSSESNNSDSSSDPSDEIVRKNNKVPHLPFKEDATKFVSPKIPEDVSDNVGNDNSSVVENDVPESVLRNEEGSSFRSSSTEVCSYNNVKSREVFDNVIDDIENVIAQDDLFVPDLNISTVRDHISDLYHLNQALRKN